MVPVAGVRSPGAQLNSPRAVRTRGGFALLEPAASRADDAAAVVAVAPASLGGMLTLQEIDDEPPRDRAARRHGQAILGALSSLQRAVLTTQLDSDALDRLVRLLESAPEPDDPRLRSLLGAVLLRAHVELAKQGR
ncbi:MAG: flagellar assembly protein FliX [Acetobacteraceae bacterium]